MPLRRLLGVYVPSRFAKRATLVDGKRRRILFSLPPVRPYLYLTRSPCKFSPFRVSKMNQRRAKDDGARAARLCALFVSQLFFKSFFPRTETFFGDRTSECSLSLSPSLSLSSLSLSSLSPSLSAATPSSPFHHTHHNTSAVVSTPSLSLSLFNGSSYQR